MLGWLFGSEPKPEFKPRKFRQTLTVFLTNGESYEKVLEAQDEDWGMMFQPGSAIISDRRATFLERAGHSGCRFGATFIPAWRIDRIEIGALEDVE